jgi:hypothetical protein
VGDVRDVRQSLEYAYLQNAFFVIFGHGPRCYLRLRQNITAIYEPIVHKMWDFRRLTILWASWAYYRDRFTFFTWHYTRRIDR